MLAFLMSCVVIFLKGLIGSLVISFGIFVCGIVGGLIIFLFAQLVSGIKSANEKL